MNWESLRLGRETDFSVALRGHPGIALFGAGREIKHLAALLNPDEFVLDVLQGRYSDQEGLLVRTTTRLIFFVKGFTSSKVEEFALDKVTSVEYTAGLVLADVTVFASGNKAEIKNTMKIHTKVFVNGLRRQLEAGKHEAPAATPAAALAPADSQGGGTLVELERLASLKERGFLSDEEFTAAKRKILGL